MNKLNSKLKKLSDLGAISILKAKQVKKSLIFTPSFTQKD